MKKNLIFGLLITLPLPVIAADQPANDNPFSDPTLQDYMETSDGYLNSKNTMNVRTDFADTAKAPASGMRDALISAPVPTLKNPAPAAARPAKEPAAVPAGQYKVTFAGDSGPLGSFVWPVGAGPKFAREYVFLTVTPAVQPYDELLTRLEKTTGFRFAGEKTSYFGSVKRTVIMGWVPSGNMPAVSRTRGVAKVSIEKKSSGVPLKAHVRFTLKVPYQNKPGTFVPDFIKKLTDEQGFSAENWFRLPQKGAGARFSMYDVTGTLPVDMIGDLSRSPFVASVVCDDDPA